jgi:predicted Ser/Thr protein kinase
MPAPPRPSVYNLQRFLLGALPRVEAAPVTGWVESSPDAARALAGIAAHDALTRAVESTVGIKSPPAPVVARVVENVTGSYAPAAESVPDVNEQTRPSGADTRSPGAPGEAPERIGPFRVVRELGRGGMGVVYEARDEQLGRRAAVKVLAPELAANSEAKQRFLREGRAVADLTPRDHIVTIYQVGEADGVPFLAMEFIEGVTLETWRKSRSAPVTADDVLWAARDLLAGLDVAHKKGVVHRDMKPANAMIERETRRVKILDFGLTRAADGGEQLTGAGRVLGTPAFMSPEQANGKPVDVRSDLFSVGVTLHALVTGCSPFARDTVLSTLLAVGTETEPPPASLPEPLRAFVARLMSKKPSDRPADAGVALAELKAVEARLAERVRAGAGGGSHPPRPPKPRWRTAVLAAGAVLMLAAVVVVVIRDKNGKKVATIEVPDDVARGGKVEVTDPNGKRTVVPIAPAKADPKGEPRGPLPAPGVLEKNARVTVTAQTAGYEDDTSDVMRLFVGRGTRGTVTEFPEGKTRCRVRLDNPAKDEVWILRDCLSAD